MMNTQAMLNFVRNDWKWQQDHAWHKQAACKDADPELFKPTVGRPNPNRPYQAFCSVCPVKAFCLEQGLAEDYRAATERGYATAPLVYGGLTPRERKRLIQGENHLEAA